MNKTPHYWAVLLTHERIDYGTILKEQPAVLEKLKAAIFQAAKQVIDEAIKDGGNEPQKSGGKDA